MNTLAYLFGNRRLGASGRLAERKHANAEVEETRLVVLKRRLEQDFDQLNAHQATVQRWEGGKSKKY